MKIDYKKIVKKIKEIHKSLEEYLDDFLDQHEPIYVSFDEFGIGNYIGGYTLDYLLSNIQIILEEENISFSLPEPYDDDCSTGKIPMEWLTNFDVEEFAKPILDKFVKKYEYLEQIKSNIQTEYFYFPDSIKIPYKKDYFELLDKETIIRVKGKNPTLLFEGIYGVPPVKVEDIKKVDTSIYKYVYDLSNDRVFEIKYCQ
jgi:hypothetical protein